MDNQLGLNNDVSVGGRKFHVQTSFSDSEQAIISNVFNEGEVIDSKRVELSENISAEDRDTRMNDVHQEMITEMEVLYYIYEKVKTVRHATSANKLGLLFLQKNLVKEAIEQFNLALEIDPNYAEAYNNYGKALLVEEDYDQAIEILEKGVAAAPRFADLRNYLGVAYLRNRNYKDAVKHLEQAIDLNPDYLGAQFHLGLAKLGESLNGTEADEPEEALRHLELSAEKMNNGGVESIEQVMELVNAGSHQEAVDRFLETKPKNVLMNFMNIENEFYLKFMYGGKGKDDSFIYDYVNKLNDIIQDNPTYADVHNNLGIAHLIQCRNLFLKALDEFRAALKINPNFKKAEKNLKLAENDGKGFLILLRAILK